MLKRAVLALIMSLCAAPALATPVAQTASGKVEGEARGDVSVFLGVPFAAPPVGALRWRAPQAVAAWQGVRPAKTFSPHCLQPPGSTGAQSEDCLYLNVYAPSGAEGLPVMVWIPGGGLIAGGASDPTLDGSALARKGVVVVTFNYRVGPLGFFAHPALTAANEDGGRLFNYGLMDQIAALEWVKRNIAAFGGDPARVTIFGVSAGGASVDALMVSTEARGLFSAAIAQSGYGRGFFRRIGTAEHGKEPAERVGIAIAERLGKPDMTMAELRAVPGAQIVAAHDYGREALFAVDGKILEGEFQPAFSAGREAPVPFLLGSNSAEMATAPLATRRRLAASLGQGAFSSLTQVYGGEEQRDRFFSSDVSFGSQARGLALRHAANGHPTYVYRFSVIAPDRSNPFGASHGEETPYVFGTMDRVRSEPKPTRPSDVAVSTEMMTRWAAFARTHRPDAEGLIPWPAYGPASQVLDFTSGGAKAGPDPLAARFDVVNAVGD